MILNVVTGSKKMLNAFSKRLFSTYLHPMNEVNFANHFLSGIREKPNLKRKKLVSQILNCPRKPENPFEAPITQTNFEIFEKRYYSSEDADDLTPCHSTRNAYFFLTPESIHIEEHELNRLSRVQLVVLRNRIEIMLSTIDLAIFNFQQNYVGFNRGRTAQQMAQLSETEIQLLETFEKCEYSFDDIANLELEEKRLQKLRDEVLKKLGNSTSTEENEAMKMDTRCYSDRVILKS